MLRFIDEYYFAILGLAFGVVACMVSDRNCSCNLSALSRPISEIRTALVRRAYTHTVVCMGSV